jgi:ribosomal protein L36
MCKNCRRSGVPLIVVNKKDMRYRQKWASGIALYFRQNSTYDIALLCEACREYITDVQSRNADGSVVWQCFIYKTLRDNLQRMRLWTILQSCANGKPTVL